VGTRGFRIFTPFNELPFAGHPVLGSAFVLAAPLQLPTIVLETGIGLVPVVLERDGPRMTFGRMTQPLPTVSAEPAAAAIVAALGGVKPVLPVERYVNGPTHVLVTVAAPDEVARADARPRRARAGDAGRVSCFAGSGRTYKTRMFAPGHGSTRTRPRARPPVPRLPPRAPRADPAGRGDPDHAGRGDGAAEHALRARRRHARAHRERGGRRLRGDGRPRRIPSTMTRAREDDR